ncbi:MAG TPA: SIR2 family protein [Pyrinomonadaceae bacterium]|nr:SIR2 family protein [Pyrinomonadaceae bacterium]
MSSSDTRPVAAVAVPGGTSADDEMLGYVAEQVAARQCVLFFGAGIHFPSPDATKFDYPVDKAPPRGRQLAERLAERCDYPYDDKSNLPRVAQYFESKKTRWRLVKEIEKEVETGREPSPVLRMLADLDFPVVITTNYDHLYERALEQTAAARGLPAAYDVSVYSPKVDSQNKTADCAARPDPARPYVLKIHGDIARPESLVVTDEDYIQFVLRMGDKHPHHPFGKNVLAHLMRWPTLFIGYSLIDYNLRLLFKTLRWRLDAAQIPPTFAVDLKPDLLIRDVWESQRRYVSFIVEDLWAFVPKLYEAVKREPPAKFQARPASEQTP